MIKKLYRKNLLVRYDKDGIVPYLSHLDFDGLNQEICSFKNSKGVDIAYFMYSYPKHRKDKVIIFCHGIGPGHTAYITEINELCKNGFKVITLDYMGCDKSGGESMPSLNEPSRDIDELINHLNLKEEIILIGHSLGGYSALNVISKRSDIKCGVIISGFISVEKELSHLVKSKLLGRYLAKYERQLEPEYTDEKILDYLKNTDDKLLFIHSIDDQMVPYVDSTKVVESLNNPNFSFIIKEDRHHNPNYTKEAVDYMTDTFAEYTELVKKHKLKTFEEKKQFFADKSALKMTVQDHEVIEKIINFIS